MRAPLSPCNLGVVVVDSGNQDIFGGHTEAPILALQACVTDCPVDMVVLCHPSRTTAKDYGNGLVGRIAWHWETLYRENYCKSKTYDDGNNEQKESGGGKNSNARRRLGAKKQKIPLLFAGTTREAREQLLWDQQPNVPRHVIVRDNVFFTHATIEMMNSRAAGWLNRRSDEEVEALRSISWYYLPQLKYDDDSGRWWTLGWTVPMMLLFQLYRYRSCTASDCVRLFPHVLEWYEYCNNENNYPGDRRYLTPSEEDIPANSGNRRFFGAFGRAPSNVRRKIQYERMVIDAAPQAVAVRSTSAWATVGHLYKRSMWSITTWLRLFWFAVLCATPTALFWYAPFTWSLLGSKWAMAIIAALWWFQQTVATYRQVGSTLQCTQIRRWIITLWYPILGPLFAVFLCVLALWDTVQDVPITQKLVMPTLQRVLSTTPNKSWKQKVRTASTSAANIENEPIDTSSNDSNQEGADSF